MALILRQCFWPLWVGWVKGYSKVGWNLEKGGFGLGFQLGIPVQEQNSQAGWGERLLPTSYSEPGCHRTISVTPQSRGQY